MFKRFVMVAGLLLVVGGAAMAQDEASPYSVGLALTYKGFSDLKPNYGVQARLGYVVAPSIDVTAVGDLYFQSKGVAGAFYGGSVGPAVHYSFSDMGGFVPYVGLGANFYFRDKWAGAATGEVNAGLKYAMSAPWGAFGEVAWELIKSDALTKTPFDLRVGLSYGF